MTCSFRSSASRTYCSNKGEKGPFIRFLREAEAPLAAPADWHKLLTADARTALPAEFVARMDELRLMPLYELLEELFTLFDMGRIGKQDAYLFSFFDAVTEYLQNNSSDLDGFIRYWDETLCIPSGWWR